MNTKEILQKKKKYRIFVVEDSDAYRTLIVEFLTRLKKSVSSDGIEYSVRGFSSGEACVENLNEEPDIVILDYYLDSGGYDKNLTGHATLNRIKQISPKTDVVMLSCQNSVEVMKQLLRSGAKDYINKVNTAPIKIYDFVSKTIRKKEKTKQRSRTIQYAAAAMVVIFAVVEFVIFFSG